MRAFIFCAVLCCAGVQAAPWEFDPSIPVTRDSAQDAFVHIESAGRKSIAVSGAWVAVAWEDNRDGVPRCYVALKAPGQAGFGDTLQVSGQEEAAEPAIVGLGGGRFALGWEEGGRVWARIVTAKSPGGSVSLAAPLVLSVGPGAQVSLGFTSRGGLFSVWSQKGERYWQIRFARLTVMAHGGIRPARAVIVDASAEGDQSYPSIAAVSGAEQWWRGKTGAPAIRVFIMRCPKWRCALCAAAVSERSRMAWPEPRLWSRHWRHARGTGGAGPRWRGCGCGRISVTSSPATTFMAALRAART